MWWLAGLALVFGGNGLAAQVDEKPLAGTLPPPPTASSERFPAAHGPLFISPMGEPFRGPAPQMIWFRQADTDHDGKVSRAEFVADADRFFAILDRGHDGEIDPDDIAYYETVLAPEIRVRGGVDGGARGPRPGGGQHGGGRGHGGRGGGAGRRGGSGSDGAGGGSSGTTTPRYDSQRQGAARFGWFDYPEPVTVADTNMNRGVDVREFRAAAEQRFAILDRNHDGVLERGELPPLPSGDRGQGHDRYGGFRHTGGEAPPPDSIGQSQ